MKFFEELKRRNVIKATMAYIVVAWVLIQVLTNILPVFQAPAWVLQTLMILLAIGLPIWIFFSWVYDVTPEGIKKTDDIATDEKITATTNKRLNILILIVLIVAVGLNFIDTDNSENTAVASNPEITRDNSIAVLPFLDMSPLKDQEYYSDGIAIEILNSLCKFKKLKVVGRTSSFAFKGKGEDIKSIGQKLNVNNILEGSVQKQQDRIRISVRLTDAENGYTVFSESYSDELENIFELQSKIAMDIAEKIESTLALADNELHPRKKVDPLSFETFLIGKSQFLNGPLNNQPGELYRAKKYFEKAVELDSNFAEANAYLSLAYFNLSDWVLPGQDRVKRNIALDSAKMLAKRAHSIDSLSSGAHLAMGSYYYHEYDWIKAEKEKRKAVALNPGGTEEKFMLASFLSQFGQTDEAVELCQEAMKSDPLDENAKLKYVRVLIFSRRFEESIALCNQMIEQSTEAAGPYQFLFMAYANTNQLEKARKAYADHLIRIRDTVMFEVFKQNDFIPAVKKSIELNDKKRNGNWPSIYMASFYSWTKDRDNTMKYLYETYNYKEPQIGWMRLPRFDFLRDDPEYQELYEKAGFKAYDEYKMKQGQMAKS